MNMLGVPAAADPNNKPKKDQLSPRPQSFSLGPSDPNAKNEPPRKPRSKTAKSMVAAAFFKESTLRKPCWQMDSADMNELLIRIFVKNIKIKKDESLNKLTWKARVRIVNYLFLTPEIEPVKLLILPAESLALPSAAESGSADSSEEDWDEGVTPMLKKLTLGVGDHNSAAGAAAADALKAAPSTLTNHL